jgi:hypothetical protein
MLGLESALTLVVTLFQGEPSGWPVSHTFVCWINCRVGRRQPHGDGYEVCPPLTVPPLPIHSCQRTQSIAAINTASHLRSTLIMARRDERGSEDAEEEEHGRDVPEQPIQSVRRRPLPPPADAHALLHGRLALLGTRLVPTFIRLHSDPGSCRHKHTFSAFTPRAHRASAPSSTSLASSLSSCQGHGKVGAFEEWWRGRQVSPAGVASTPADGLLEALMGSTGIDCVYESQELQEDGR